MKNKASESLIYSAGGVIALVILLIAVNFIANIVRGRADLSEGSVYTLSSGTKKVLANLPTPVKIRYYATKSENAMPVQLKGFARRVEDLLAEYKQLGKGKVILEKYDPLPDSDAEDSANLDGVEPQILATGERFHLGLSVSHLDQKVSIAALSPERETLLEYDLTRAISQVTRANKPVIGIMTALPIFGRPMPMAGMPPQPAWAFLEELKRDYLVKDINLNVEHIDDDVTVLLIAHPRDIKDSAQYAIDQFILRGGKVVAFVDPYAYFDQMQNPQNPQMPMGGGGASSLDKLFKAWGIGLEQAKVVSDLENMRRGGQRILPTLLTMTGAALDSKDIVTGQVGNVLLPFAGAFNGKPVAGLTQTVLVKSSKSAALSDALTATQQMDPNSVTIQGKGVEYPIAIKLTGKFKTAFPEGKPKTEPKTPDNPDAKPEQEKKAADKPQIKESTKENVVVLVADADMLSDQASVQVQEFLGQRILVPISGNLNFVQSMVELYSGDDNLINLRSRAVQFRPLTVIQKMQAKAAEAYAGKIKEVEESLATTKRRISELQQTKTEGQQFILSPEQKKELENFRGKQVQANKDLKELRKSLRADTDALETKTKFINVAGMPILVAIIGLVLAAMKRKRVAAR